MNGLFNDDNFSVPVAVKKMSWSALGAFPVIKMRMRMRLAHPNICFFFSGFLRTTGGSLPSDSRSDPFISASSSELATVELSAVIELSKFGSLAKYVAARKSSFSEAEVRSVALDTLRALEYLHFEVRAAHGDVKPLNILLFDKEEEDHPQFYGEIENFSVEHKKAAERKVSSFRMKIADFGTLTPIVPQDDVRTQLSREDGEYDPQGTFLYMSPEACLGCVGLPSIDVWALGIMLYQLATGTSPWSQTECSYPSIIGGNYRRKFEDRLSLLQDDHVSTGPLAEFGPFLDALEKDSASSELKDFVKSCLIENPLKRPTCRDLLSHPFMTKETS
ncbi:protein kinase [Angomonas deanei]|uniref:Protein kinase domain/Protein tyrosine kinase, putative n=1 Tax=Angomonas deanei TaxID=59799 RepID=A0A7G2CSS4_9TRYP|nr:protein kinase [Angomonas deanei]CAD2222810.1 Protein kinase domain/Protein tyrosine kinase, putative [Angomonas deanei]|eukprot:EPY35762.1 protein kinase [Angomonas deanei]